MRRWLILAQYAVSWLVRVFSLLVSVPWARETEREYWAQVKALHG